MDGKRREESARRASRETSRLGRLAPALDPRPNRSTVRCPKAQVTGKYFYHLKRMEPNPQAHDPALQDRLIAICTEISGVALPASSGQAIVPRN
jgi:hypothetical protein